MFSEFKTKLGFKNPDLVTDRGFLLLLLDELENDYYSLFMKRIWILILFSINGFCWDVLRYNSADNSLYIGSTRIVSAGMDQLAEPSTYYWDETSRTVAAVKNGYLFSDLINFYIYINKGSTYEEVGGTDYFQFTDRLGVNYPGDYGPSYQVLFDDERQRNTVAKYYGYSPTTQWVTTRVPSNSGRPGSTVPRYTGYIVWRRAVSISPTPSDVPVTKESSTVLPPGLDVILNPPEMVIPAGTLRASKSQGRAGTGITIEYGIR